MNLAEISVKRPIFITCVFILMLAVGYLSLKKLPVDMFPNVTFPVVLVDTVYPGAGPHEIETLVSKPLEDEIGTLTGIKKLSSINSEGLSMVVAEFTLETDIKYAGQQIRDKVSATKSKLPREIEEPVIRIIDPSDQPVVFLSITSDLPESQLYDLANEVVKPKLEQVNQVGRVDVVGARKREIRVALDRNKLKSREISASMVAARIKAAGEDVPLGKYDQTQKEVIYRALGEFKSIKDIESTIVSFFGNDVPVKVSDLGHVSDSLEDEKSRTYVNGKRSLLLLVFRQSGSNTIRVVDDVKKRIAKLNDEFKIKSGSNPPHLDVVRDTSRVIRANVEDVKESIMIGIALTIVVVFFFLGNGRSTLITGLALPNSLLGAFVLMAAGGFTINVMTLLALSLTVGLLIDDAIVVRENIFRHMENGESPMTAALKGTSEVALAVIATTLTVIAVFGPIAFLQGMVGQFFKEFGLTICFAMLISLFDAFTMAPMLSAYLGGSMHSKAGKLWESSIGRVLDSFNRFQDKLEVTYVNVLKWVLKHPLKTIGASLVVFFVCTASVAFVPKTFLPPQDFGEFAVSIEMPPGTSLKAVDEVAKKVDDVIRSNKEVKESVLIVGGRESESYKASFTVELVPVEKRKVNTSQFKDRLRDQLKAYSFANPVVKDIDAVAAGMRPFNVNIIGTDLGQLEAVAVKAFEVIKKNPGLKDPDISFRPGKPEFQVALDNKRAQGLGISSLSIGQELRTQIEGVTPAKFRENGIEYDIRVRLQEDQRDLKQSFNQTFVPNINNALVRLSDVAKPVESTGPATINRQDRARYVQIAADLAPGGGGMAQVMKDIRQIFEVDQKLPPGMRYAFVGQAENFQELNESMGTAMMLGVLFIFLVLSSLYESFVTPFTIMLVLPLAACGAFIALFITRASLDLFSMIGCVMLMGIATKNSILLVDYANQLVRQGRDRATAMMEAGKTRLRPILMTTVALVAGMMPVAIGLNEASRQRVSMGISVIGGLISSTLLTLVVVPASFSYIDRFRVWSQNFLKRNFAAGGSSGASLHSKSTEQEM